MSSLVGNLSSLIEGQWKFQGAGSVKSDQVKQFPQGWGMQAKEASMVDEARIFSGKKRY